MKYIFRYTISSYFPHPHTKISESQLQQALRSVKFQFDKYNLAHLQEIFLNCIQEILNKPQQKVINLIEDTLIVQQNQKLPQFNSKDLQTIWQQQKVNIYKSILQNSCKSSRIYKDLQWSVKNFIMRRAQSLNKGNNLISRLHINCLQNPSQPQGKNVIDINLNKKGVERMYNSLVECQNAIDEILMSGE